MTLAEKILPLLSLLLLSSTGIWGQFMCPAEDEVSPCTCTIKGSKGTLICNGPNVTQNSIDTLFSLTRSANNLSSMEGLPLSTFEMENTPLTSLDLTAFIQCEMEAFYLNNNNELASIIVPTNSTDDEEVSKFKFSSGWVSSDNSQLGDEGVATLLKFLVPESVDILSFIANQIQGPSEPNAEILAGFPKFVNLQRLFLDRNQIERIGGGQFKSNSKMDALFLWGNRIVELGPDAFLLEPNADMVDVTFEIWLDSNNLTNDRIQPTHGLQGNGRPTVFLAAGNQFDFISAENFESFLLADSRNELYLQNNAWVCDERMAWLKRQRDLFQHRVFGMDCSNDPGFNVFTTSLISIDSLK